MSAHKVSAATPVGSFDNLDNTSGLIWGWAYDPDNSGASIAVHIYADGPAGSGKVIDATQANLPRADLNTLFNITGNHGFNYYLPASLKDGKPHTLYLYGIDTSGVGSQNVALSGVPKTFKATLITVEGRVITDGTSNDIWQNTPGKCGNYKAASAMRINGASLDNCGPNAPTDGPFYRISNVPTGSREVVLTGLPAGYTCGGWAWGISTGDPKKDVSLGRNVFPAGMTTCSTGPLSMLPTDPAYGQTHAVWFSIIAPPPVVPTAIPTPPSPVGLSASCPVPGTVATLKWTAVSGATAYALRIDDAKNSWKCDGTVFPGDFCGTATTNSYTFATTPGDTYTWWVHASGPGGLSNATAGSFSCPIAPTPTFFPRVTSTTAPTPKPSATPTVKPSAVPSIKPTVKPTLPPISCTEPIDVMFVLDRTSSMTVAVSSTDKKTKLDYAKAAAQAFIARIQSSAAAKAGNVRVGITTFGRTLATTQATNSTIPLSTNLAAVSAKIASITLQESGTCIECGLQVANTDLAVHWPDATKASKKVAIVLTDGRANRTVASNGDGVPSGDAGRAAIAKALAGKNLGYGYFVVGIGSTSSTENTTVTKAIASSPTSTFYRSQTDYTQWDSLFTQFADTACKPASTLSIQLIK
jgi:hypothetical protein